MKVLAALSGGVDSSVTASLLQDAGHDVVGVTMKLWGGESDSGCCSVSDVEDARRSAAQLGVDHHVFNFGEEFEEHVVAPYVSDHAQGRTPNPCVECNRHLKFDVLLKRAELLGFDAVATGHHARVVVLADGTRRIGRGADAAKDQSYVLYPLTAAELELVMFPIGEMTKDDVRRLAAELGLRTATKPDSQDVCFITKSNGRSEFLSARTELHPGKIVDESGVELGGVEAVELVTVGQRRGLNLAGGSGRRFVTDVDVKNTTVTVGPPERLLREQVVLEQMVWADGPVEGRVRAQSSAHGVAIDASLGVDAEGLAVIVWDKPQRRVASGQSVVLYQTLPTAGGAEEVVVGGGLAR
ncbi:MAG TPA: tRNA 2-thiouridine(34) synthase MnmA [Microthrixaceae bacterium]|nr:tRNA 2-thiouridine(34) synthase MnmA [Microthrixaceae bacterium]